MVITNFHKNQWFILNITGIKYRKSTIRNQSLFQKHFFLCQWASKGVKWITNMFKKGGFFQTSQSNNGRFGYI
jgi:hypothetical protein